jgi:RNase H-like domain found in reverse transcriptase
MDPAKVAGVSEWPVLTTKKEVQLFLGTVNFHRRFIEGFSHLATPLFNLTKNDSIFYWSSDEQTAFSALKERITSTPILNNSKPFWIEADRSDFATRAVLSQQSSEDNKWHLIAFLSKFLSPVEQNYEIHDKEMLAIVRPLEEWRHFVEGVEHQVEIWMDHKNLEYFMTAKKLNQRQARWSLLLAKFDFLMPHLPGRTMGKSDALSQRLDHSLGAKDNDNIVLLTPNFLAI